MNQTEASGAGSAAIGGDVNESFINTGTLILTLPRQDADRLPVPERRLSPGAEGRTALRRFLRRRGGQLGYHRPRAGCASQADGSAAGLRPRSPAARHRHPPGTGGRGEEHTPAPLAWELAEGGLPRLLVRDLPPPGTPVEGRGGGAPDAWSAKHDRPLIFCFDDADQLDEVPPRLRQDAERGANLRYRLFGAARFHQWQHARLTLPLSPQTFELKAMERVEVETLLERMEAHGGLGALAELPPRSACAVSWRRWSTRNSSSSRR